MTLAVGALAGQQRLGAHAAVGAAEADRDPVERAVAGHLGALGAEDPRLLVEVLPADVAQAGVLADDELDDRVQQRLGLVVAGQVLLPHLGLGALLEHDQHAPLQRGAGRGGDGGQQDRGLDAHAARDPHERAAVPRVLVPAREDVVGRDDAAEVRLDQLGMALAGDRQREHDRAVLDRDAVATARRRPGRAACPRAASNRPSGDADEVAAVGGGERATDRAGSGP